MALWTAVLVTMAASEPALAQRRGEGPPGPDRTEMQRRIQARFGEIVRQQLGLRPEEQEALVGVIREAEGRRRELERREARFRADLRSEAPLLPRGDSSPLLSEERAREVLAQMREFREEGLQLFRAEQEQLLEILTPPQLVRFYGLREQLAQRVRRLQQGPPRGGLPGRPNGGRPGGGR